MRANRSVLNVSNGRVGKKWLGQSSSSLGSSRHRVFTLKILFGRRLMIGNVENKPISMEAFKILSLFVEKNLELLRSMFFGS